MVILRRFIGSFVLSLLGVVLLAGCSGDRIDGSSKEAFTASIEKIAQGLPEKEAAEFRKALSVIAIKHLDLAAILAGKKTVAESGNDALRQSLNGKTAAEVVEMGAEARAELMARRSAAQKTALQRQPAATPLQLPKPGQRPALPSAPQSSPPAADTAAPVPQS